MDIFDDSKIVNLSHWSKEWPGKEGTIMMAIFELAGKAFMCSVSPPLHNWDISAAV